MTISIWRYSHLVLAIISSLFLIVASITGAILAIEPVHEELKKVSFTSLENVALDDVINLLKNKDETIVAIEVTPSESVKGTVIDSNFETRDVYINPFNGQFIKEVPKRATIYSFSTNLHRSLFLKSTGRILVGVVSFLLVLISITGIALLIKRQGSITKFFSSTHSDFPEMKYHVLLSRWFLIPICIISLSGVYLSLERFQLLPQTAIESKKTNDTNTINSNAFQGNILQQISLDQVKKVSFPFSEDPNDFFTITLKKKEITVVQSTKKVLDEVLFPTTSSITRTSLLLHTGLGSPWWSIILFTTCISLLYFIYSGFTMTIKRKKKSPKFKNIFTKETSEYIILVGSETGTTFQFAERFYHSLTDAGCSVYLSELNEYSVYEHAKHIIVFTATYGEGEAPSNARKFESILSNVKQPKNILYTIVGFGSLEYPDYCKFAIKVDALLQKQDFFTPLLPLHKINNANENAFVSWTKNWGVATGLSIQIVSPTKTKKNKTKTFPCTVLEKVDNHIDDTYLLYLKPEKKIKFASGDLLLFIPPGTTAARKYSIAKINNTILLSIKKHKKGIASSYLYDVEIGTTLETTLELNPKFNLSKNVPSALFIANGTGIAPFLGMLHENKNIPVKLFWGGRNSESLTNYKNIIDSVAATNPSFTYKTCASREGNSTYVQDILAEKNETVHQIVNEGGSIFICGSIAMQHEVLDVLEVLLKSNSKNNLSELLHSGRLKMDCY